MTMPTLVPAPTAADIIDLLAPRLPETLVSRISLERIRGIASLLPAGLCDCLGFEVELGLDSDRADFAVQVVTPDARKLMVELISMAEFVRSSEQARAWSGVAQFVRAWQQPSSVLSSLVTSLWLEFDAGLGRVVPAVFVAGEQDGFAGQGGLSALGDALGMIAGEPAPAATWHLIAAHLAALGPSARLAQVGTMLSRDQTPVRACLMGLAADQIVTGLAAIGAAGHGQQLAALLDDLDTEGLSFAIDLDVIDGRRYRASIEISLPTSAQLGGGDEPRWRPVLDRLVRIGACSRQQQDGILAWNGVSVEQLPHLAQPTRVYRGLSHIKLDLTARGDFSAKAYIGYLPDRLSLLLNGPLSGGPTPHRFAEIEVP